MEIVYVLCVALACSSRAHELRADDEEEEEDFVVAAVRDYDVERIELPLNKRTRERGSLGSTLATDSGKLIYFCARENPHAMPLVFSHKVFFSVWLCWLCVHFIEIERDTGGAQAD